VLGPQGRYPASAGREVLLRIGETIDRYTIEALIGQGGMAAVYRVRHVRLDSEHALKVLFITAPKICDRLIREGRVQANLRHANIVSVTDVLNIQGSPALVMEYVDGPALDTWLIENHPTLEEGLWLFRGILRGISAAHDRGVVHRDLKPANVLLSPSDEGFIPKVTDFGLVKSVVEQKGDTQTGMSLGTPEYMSPEQIRDASDIDVRADMWALGCILYELTCHRRAFSGNDKMAIFNRIVAGQYEPPRNLVEDLPRNVSEAIRGLLEVDRNKRLASCEALQQLLYSDRELKGRISAPIRPVSPIQLDPPSLTATGPKPPPPQLSVPTGAPAAQRMSVPFREPRRDGLPRRHTVAIPQPVPARGRSLTGVIALLLVIIVVAGSWLLTRPSPSPAAELAKLPEMPPPVPVAPIQAPASVPVAVEPEVVAAPPAPMPARPRPRPNPLDSFDLPPPPGVGSRGGPAPSAEVVRGRVMVVGDARSVWLVSTSGQRHDPAQPVLPGSYQVMADFGGAPTDAGRVDVKANGDLTLTCSAHLSQCRPL
jgi:serine/threonine protein kinase